MPDYAELQVTSNFSFLRGASHPGELVRRAAALGHRAIAITDRNTLAGIVRAHVAAKEAGLRLVVGCRLDLTGGETANAETPSASLLCYPTDRAAYGRLARLLTLGKRRAVKGQCQLDWSDVFAHGAGQIFAFLPPDRIDTDFAERLRTLARRFPGHVYLAVSHLYRGNEARRFARLATLAAEIGVPLVAVNDVHYHEPGRRPLQDVLACIRWGCTIEQAGLRLAAHAERYLKPAEEMARLFRRHPDAVARSIDVAGRCRFSLDELRYEYPDEATEDGRTPQQELAFRTWEGAARRYPEGVPDKVAAALTHELALIAELGYAPYFLTVWDIVRFARGRGILCQGRGSAANSAVCFCLGVTAIDPAKFDLLFERFVSAARNEPPDIDVDFEHERREEVIQYIYAKYGRERAGLTAVVISYRGRSAVRDVGKAMGLSEDMVTALTRDYRHWGHSDVTREHFREIGVDPDAPGVAQTMKFASDIQGFPRHLSQHVGGFVMTRGPLCDVVPIENAAMADRTVIEWDKDDLDALGILKVDVLALGMLTCIRKAFDLIALHYGQRFEIATVPSEDPAVYEMLQRADALGVFQVESRAQLSMLPRLKPRTFYDLVIEVAIVRPGPIQGGMVHPYLRRREGRDPVDYPSPALEGVLRKTLGVPLFQEQAMNIAIVGAGFTPEEADRLRRSMASFKRNGDIAKFRDKFVNGMVANGCVRDFAERCFGQIEGFSTYGFPESHAASFAVLVYVSAWLKCHYPAVFAAALLNSQPMGFYAPAQLVRDAREHGVDVREADVNKSDWDCTLEKKPDDTVALRLGLRQIVGFAADSAEKLTRNRGDGYADPHAVWRRAGLPPAALETLARADAWRSMGLGRREALWAIRALGAAPLPLFAACDPDGASEVKEPAVALPSMTPGEAVVDDYRALRLTLREHPVTFLRDDLMRSGVVPARHLTNIPAGGHVTVAGLVLVRQRPGSAKGVVFVTLEDETGVANLIVYSDVFERDRRVLLGARLMGATGRIERQGTVIHVLVRHLYDWTDKLHALIALPDNVGLARADEVKRPGYDPRGLPVASRDFH